MINITITSAPSRSKGWGRFGASSGGVPVITSSTGNPWVSAGHSAAVEEGAEVKLTLQVQLNIGKGFNARKETTSKTVMLIAEDGAECEVEHKPGSQGLTLRITGARLA
jgi:hypothetical protein